MARYIVPRLCTIVQVPLYKLFITAQTPAFTGESIICELEVEHALRVSILQHVDNPTFGGGENLDIRVIGANGNNDIALVMVFTIHGTSRALPPLLRRLAAGLGCRSMIAPIQRGYLGAGQSVLALLAVRNSVVYAELLCIDSLDHRREQ